MATSIEEKAGIEEMYQTANNASNLRMDTRDDAPRGAVDVVTAAGWSPVRMGSALMRLHSEYDGGEQSQRRKGVTETDAILMAGRLKTLPAVIQHLTDQAALWAMEDGPAKAKTLVLWWLDRQCKKCTGRKFELIPGTPALSNRWCQGCRGTGEAHLPHGPDGRRLAGYMDDCVQRARQSIKKRLRPRNG